MLLIDLTFYLEIYRKYTFLLFLENNATLQNVLHLKVMLCDKLITLIFCTMFP